MQNARITMQTFYNVDQVNFKDITLETLKDLLIRSKEINKLYLNTNFRQHKSGRYLRIMELINSNYRQDIRVKNNYATVSVAEKYLLFAFSIDPTFEAAIIYGSEDRTTDAKKQIKEKFGVYDINLIKIEKIIIKKFLSEKKRNEINEEIERRAFK